jgi:predicted nucleotidyltransferase
MNNMTTKTDILHVMQANKGMLAAFGVDQVGLFGSYVREEQSPNSDIDILVHFKPEQETFDNLMFTYDLFENLFKGFKVEVVTTSGLSPYIGPQILREVEFTS